MRIFLTTLIFILFVGISEHVIAQKYAENEIVVIKGEKYIMHHVRTGETIYSLSKKYKVNQADLEKLNPAIKNGLSIGQILKIPFVENVDSSPDLSAIQKGDPSGFETHKIKSRKETPYFIAKKYGITVEELYAYNPRVRKFKRGTKLNIPYWNTSEQAVEGERAEDQIITDETEIVTHKVVSGETLYSISRRYGISESTIIETNPEAMNLKAGMVLMIKKKVTIGDDMKPEPTLRDDNISYFEHIIESGETMWGTTRKYKVSEAELKELNPILNTGFPAGAVIKIPVRELEKTIAQPVNEAAFSKHVVEKGETLYGLSKKYEISIPDIKKYNPALEKRNLVYGETILIPVKPNEIFQQITGNNKVDSARLVEEYYQVELPIEIPETCLPDFSEIQSGKIYKIALFLPLFFEANDTLNREDLVIDSTAIYSEEEVEIARDTTIEMEERKELFKQFYGGSENFVQFYEGVLIAVDSLQQRGVPIELNVYDTQRNIDSVRQCMMGNNFLATDLIIGPIYPKFQKEVAGLAAKNRIPMISPLASQSGITENNSRYFQVNPSRNYLTEQTAEMVAEEFFNSNFIVVKTNDYKGTPEGRLVDLLREKFFNSGFLSSKQGVNFTVYDFQNEGAFGLRRIMSKNKENVIYIPSSNEGKLSVAISNVNNLADDYSITLIGSNRYPNYSSIQLEHYHNLKLKFITPYWTDYSDTETIAFIEKFKNNFGTEPNNFGFQGYDVTMYFITALTTYGHDFANCLPYLHTQQMQGSYHFEKITQFGGYMNEGTSVVSYTPDYKVVRKRIKGRPRLVTASNNE